MHVEVQVYPKLNLSPDDYKRLGEGIFQWMYAPDAFGERNAWSAGFEDLRLGELPQPIYIQRIVDIEARGLEDHLREHLPNVRELTPEERQQLKERLGESRHVELRVSGSRARDREWIVTTLRTFIDERLVQDVLIEGITWNESFDFDIRLYKHDCLSCHIIPKSSCTPDDLILLGESIQKWWNDSGGTPDNRWILLPGVWSLNQGRLPDAVEQQFEEVNAEQMVEPPAFAERELCSVMFMQKRNMNTGGNLLRVLRTLLPSRCVDGFIIDELRFDASDG